MPASRNRSEGGRVSFKPNGILNTVFSISYTIILYILATLQLGMKKAARAIGRRSYK